MRKEMPGRGRAARKLAKVNRKISRLSAELETLQFMQDRLEKELEPGAARRPRRDAGYAENKMGGN